MFAVKKFGLQFTILLLFTFSFQFCANPFNISGGAGHSAPVQVFYNEPGSNEETSVDHKIDLELVSLIDSARESVYLAVYNFSRDSVLQALNRAEKRGIDLRIVGDINEYYTEGYRALSLAGIDLTLGNSSGIMHNKFAVIDSETVFTGTGNITDNGFLRNNNNFLIFHDKALAAYFNEEFMRMYGGMFAKTKNFDTTETGATIADDPNAQKGAYFNLTGQRLSNREQAVVEVYFAPYQAEAAMARLIELTTNATESVHYMIFAHTYDELSAAMIKAARENNTNVAGIHDSTFTIGVSEEAPRLDSAAFNNDGSKHSHGPHIRWDGNEHTAIKNNPSSGGKMHCKTMIFDAGTDKAILATGSFNWSNNAVENNDENLIIIKDAAAANTVYEQFKRSWAIANSVSPYASAQGTVKFSQRYGETGSERQVIISEIGWAGSADSSINSKDDFIEIYNTGAQPVDLSHWSISWYVGDQSNFFEYKNFPIPDTYNRYYTSEDACSGISGYSSGRPNIICPGEYKLIYNENPSAWALTGGTEKIEYDSSGSPIILTGGSRDSSPHIRIAGTKGFELSEQRLHIILYDKAMNKIDAAGVITGGIVQKPPAGCTGKAEIYTDIDCDGSIVTDTVEVRTMQRDGIADNTIANGESAAEWFNSPAKYDCLQRPVDQQFDACLGFITNTYATAAY